MDSNDLLQDLHFQLSNAGSGCPNRSRDNNPVEAPPMLDTEDRTLMIKKWVAQVHKQHRQRSLSSDSYFGAESVCDKLKKSFLLKQDMVTEEDLEDLRLRIAQIKIQDSEISAVDQKVIDLSDLHKTASNPLLSKRLVSRTRSETVPITKFCQYSLSRSIIFPKTTEKLHCNLSAVQSVDLIKDILFDQNRNIISCQDCNPDGFSKHEEVQKKLNFRCESIIPHPNELKQKKQNIDISPNNIFAHYENVESYLNTQFYLLKEDFIRPLKDGIADYRSQLCKGVIPQEVKNLNLHHNVCVIEPRFKDNKLGIAIDLGFPLSEKIGDKSFMEGSLVLLTQNHFNDIIVGTVLFRQFLPREMQRNEMVFRRKRGRSNILIIQLHDASHFKPALRCRKFLLAESQAFFQPFYYVMKIFQSMTEDDVPMQQHIIGSEIKEKIGSPSYLMKDAEYILENQVKVKVLENDWPSAEVLKVNDSQLHAFKKALSSELVLIQGPPGTGKTYLGCKVAKALLENRQVWNKEGNQPMLLMCQTNHALDQFMELLLPVSQKLLRIGCQSKSNVLAPYNIREWLRKGRRKAGHSSDAKRQRNELQTIKSNIQSCQTELLRVTSHGILNLQTFVDFGVVKAKCTECFINSANFLMWLEEEQYSKCHFMKGCTSAKMVPIKRRCFQHYPENILLSMLENESGSGCILNKTDNGNQTEKNMVKGVVFEYALDLSDLEMNVRQRKAESPNMNHSECKLHDQIKVLEDRLIFFRNQLAIQSTAGSPTVRFDCLWDISPDNRWSLYRYWVKQLEKGLQGHLEALEHSYISVSSAVDHLKQLEKLEAMREAELVGMTTSAAARLYPVLRELHCPIEEAAEVLESHIVATITKHCQHLILIGDHKQLRPRPASYSLSKTHFTDVSLFERLALNKTVNVNILLTQHRMQPQISALIRPSIYRELQDHKCTKNRNHNISTCSYKNIEEAKMAAQLARYLLREKYNVDEVCILTAYREQVSEIEENCALYPELSGLRVLTIDNFQGEECRIVILSLVRNNRENRIGFLQIENRVCVALSRARDGLFMLGNIDMLSRNSKLWASVNRTLSRSGSVGKSFPLCCSQHPKETKWISHPDYFADYIDNIEKLNEILLSRCQEACMKTCVSGHRCNKLCSEECGGCESIVWKLLPCGHKALIKCSLDTSNYLCGVPVKKRMEPCSHSLVLQCWMPPISKKYCPNQCQSLLKCGHKCPRRCNSIRHPNHNEIKCKCEDKSSSIINRILGKV
ncbi:NFX1-type zinc finger-containing protein 1 [Frankliniella fusca]|uniref:NFX1-type zinc finger-containing protein 1 n=1 Tax=Frankliniella fusca TaxID=407009 RepID=A0AAE1L6R3_9NEOP|nr:NFX1-type zinc finger-containing protein 1 [Frankliniella fusca]